MAMRGAGPGDAGVGGRALRVACLASAVVLVSLLAAVDAIGGDPPLLLAAAAAAALPPLVALCAPSRPVREVAAASVAAIVLPALAAGATPDGVDWRLPAVGVATAIAGAVLWKAGSRLRAPMRIAVARGAAAVLVRRSRRLALPPPVRSGPDRSDGGASS